MTVIEAYTAHSAQAVTCELAARFQFDNREHKAVILSGVGSQSPVGSYDPADLHAYPLGHLLRGLLCNVSKPLFSVYDLLAFNHLNAGLFFDTHL